MKSQLIQIFSIVLVIVLIVVLFCNNNLYEPFTKKDDNDKTKSSPSPNKNSYAKPPPLLKPRYLAPDPESGIFPIILREQQHMGPSPLKSRYLAPDPESGIFPIILREQQHMGPSPLKQEREGNRRALPIPPLVPPPPPPPLPPLPPPPPPNDPPKNLLERFLRVLLPPEIFEPSPPPVGPPPSPPLEFEDWPGAPLIKPILPPEPPEPPEPFPPQDLDYWAKEEWLVGRRLREDEERVRKIIERMEERDAWEFIDKLNKAEMRFEAGLDFVPVNPQ